MEGEQLLVAELLEVRLREDQLQVIEEVEDVFVGLLDPLELLHVGLGLVQVFKHLLDLPFADDRFVVVSSRCL